MKNLDHFFVRKMKFYKEIVYQIQMSLCYNFSPKIESYLCVRVTRGRLIYNQFERAQKYYQNGKKIKVLATSNQKLKMRGISKECPHSRRGGAQKTDFYLICQTFCSVELFYRKC